MGLLDDAIREHLELKRRVGADPDEVARLEREAFGAKEAAQAATEPDAEVAEPPAAAPEPEPEPAPVAVEPAPVAPEPEPEPEPEPVAVEQPTRQFTLEEIEDAEKFPPPPPAEPPAREPESAPAAPEAEVDDGEHDELEETPDFLQETPEHDRLWFEQKPPKDFDF